MKDSEIYLIILGRFVEEYQFAATEIKVTETKSVLRREEMSTKQCIEKYGDLDEFREELRKTYGIGNYCYRYFVREFFNQASYLIWNLKRFDK